MDEKRQERWIETVESIDFTHTPVEKPDTLSIASLHSSYSKMVVLPTLTATSEDKFGKGVAKQWKGNNKDVNMSTPFTTGELVKVR